MSKTVSRHRMKWVTVTGETLWEDREEAPSVLSLEGSSGFHHPDRLGRRTPGAHRVGGPAILGPSGFQRWTREGKITRDVLAATRPPRGLDEW
jgi:hypothetical protein